MDVEVRHDPVDGGLNVAGDRGAERVGQALLEDAVRNVHDGVEVGAEAAVEVRVDCTDGHRGRVAPKCRVGPAGRRVLPDIEGALDIDEVDVDVPRRVETNGAQIQEGAQARLRMFETDVELDAAVHQ